MAHPALRPRLRRHLGWPLLLLLVSVGIAALTAVQAQRASASHRRTAAQLLHDYSAIAAWSYGRRAEDALTEVAWAVLNPILHREPHALHSWPDAASLLAYRDSALAWCQCDPVFRGSHYVSFTLGAPPLATEARTEAGTRLDSAVVLRLHDSLTRHVRDARQPRDRMGIVAVPHRGAPVLAAYGLMPTEWGDTIVYAFSFDAAALERAFHTLAAREELLPRAVTRGLPGDSLLAVRVTAPDGATLFASAGYPGERWPYQSDARLSTRVGALGVRAAVRPEGAAALVDGGLPRSRLPFLLALFALAAALSLVAVRQLRREQELARLRADFVASVSHELRTPLAQMRLFLETLRLGRWRTEEQRDWLLGHADREATRLSHLVENVLAFARSGRGSAAVAPAGGSVADVAVEVHEAVRAFAPLAEARGVAVRVDATAGHGPATARLEHGAFRQVLLNLLDNAVKYGPQGQTVTVRVSREPGRDGGVVRVAVEDEGPGVPAAERARVWEPFVRGTGDAARATGGSGIGLAIVREAMAAHGGRAWLETADGGGARAVVELPAAPAPSVPTPDAAPSAAAPSDRAPSDAAEPAEIA